MARSRKNYDREQFAARLRDIVAEKGTTETAKRFGKSADTIRQWASGKRAPLRTDPTVDKVSRSYAQQKRNFETDTHREKVEKQFGGEKPRSASMLDYMKVLNNAHPLSRNAKQQLMDLHAQGQQVHWTGTKVIPISGVRIAPAMSIDSKSPPPAGGAMALGLTSSYVTGEKGKRQQRVHGIVTQKINRGVYRTMGNKIYPEKQTPAAFAAETKRIHLETPVSKQKHPSIYLGFSDLD